MKKTKLAENLKKEVDNLASQVEKKLGKLSASTPSPDDQDQSSRYVPAGAYGQPYYGGGAGYQQQHFQQQPAYMPQQAQAPQPYVFNPHFQQQNHPYAPPPSPQMHYVLHPQPLPQQINNQSPHIYHPHPQNHQQQQEQSSSSQSNNLPPPSLPPNHYANANVNMNGMPNGGYENANTLGKDESRPSPIIPRPPAALNPSAEEMRKFIIETSTVATLKSCRILGVQPWFCSLRVLPSGGGISEEFHCDLRSLLTANFKSISMQISDAAVLQQEFESRNRQIFSDYNCEIRHQHPTLYRPAVLIETFGNYHEMLQVYYAQSLKYMKAVNNSGQANRRLDHPRTKDPSATCTSLKFALVNESGK